MNPTSRVDYVIDLTKEYRNMLSSTSYDCDLNASENIAANTIGSVPANTPADIPASAPINASTQTFTWADEELVESSTDVDMNMSERSGADIAAFSDSGYNFQPQNRYTFLNDDLGSTMRMLNGTGVVQATYGYDEFGQEILDGINTLKNVLGKVADLVNPFGFVGYQLDDIADDYFAEAREYRPEEGRFSGIDKVRGFIEMPFTLNRYGYCYNNGMLMNDLNGMWPNPIKWVKDKTKKAAKAVKSAVEYTIKHPKQILCAASITVAVVGVSTLLPAPAAGALLGGGLDVAWQLANGAKFSEIDWKEVGIQTVSGVCFSGVGNVSAHLATKVTSKIGASVVEYGSSAVMSGTIGGASTFITDATDSRKSWKETWQDTKNSFVSNAAMGALFQKFDNNYAIKHPNSVAVEAGLSKNKMKTLESIINNVGAKKNALQRELKKAMALIGKLKPGTKWVDLQINEYCRILQHNPEKIEEISGKLLELSERYYKEIKDYEKYKFMSRNKWTTRFFDNLPNRSFTAGSTYSSNLLSAFEGYIEGCTD